MGFRVSIRSSGIVKVELLHHLKDLVTGSGLRFVERGVQRLKGVEGEWPLHAAE
jgi:hypothetical protein